MTYYSYQEESHRGTLMAYHSDQKEHELGASRNKDSGDHIVCRARQLGIIPMGENDLCVVCVLPWSEPAINFCAVPALHKDHGRCGVCGEGVCDTHLTQHPIYGTRCTECVKLH